MTRSIPLTPRGGLTLTSTGAYSSEREAALLGRADICLVGGEDISGHNTRHDGKALAAADRRLCVLDIVTSLDAVSSLPLHGADILLQARSGLVFEAYPDRPALLGFVPSAYGAALNGLIALSAALLERERTGRGQMVRAGLLEGALSWPIAFWSRAETPTPRFTFKAPRGARPLIFRTRDGVFLQIVLGSVGSKYRLYRALGIDDPTLAPDDAGLPNPADGPERYFGDVERIAPYVARRDSAELMAALTEAGAVFEQVFGPAEAWDVDQARENGIIASTDNGVEQVGQPACWTAVPSMAPTRTCGGSVPLAGVKVVDFGAFVAGPLVSVGLADLGAEVIKVEPPQGDPLRNIYSYYIAANRGKRSISIAMKSAEGLALAHRLADRADIVCSNFRNGVAERLGIDAKSLHGRDPGKIVVVNAGYGISGPRADNPAFDPCMQAYCGHEARAGGQGNPPALNPMMMIDVCGAMVAEVGALMALHRRSRDGSGAMVTVPLLNIGLFLLSDIVRTPSGSLHGPLALLPDQTGYHPAEKLYRTEEGWIAISARGSLAARALGEALGIADQLAAPWLSWSEAEMAAIAAAIRPYSSEAILDLLRRAGVSAELCRDDGPTSYLLDDANLATGRIYQERQPDLGVTRGLGRMFDLAEPLPPATGHISAKGSDARAILTELGLGTEEIDDLIERKIVTVS